MAKHTLHITETPGRITLEIHATTPKRARIVDSYDFDKAKRTWTVHVGPGNNPQIITRRIHEVLRYYKLEAIQIERKGMTRYFDHKLMTEKQNTPIEESLELISHVEPSKRGGFIIQPIGHDENGDYMRVRLADAIGFGLYVLNEQSESFWLGDYHKLDAATNALQAILAAPQFYFWCEGCAMNLHDGLTRVEGANVPEPHNHKCHNCMTNNATITVVEDEEEIIVADICSKCGSDNVINTDVQGPDNDPQRSFSCEDCDHEWTVGYDAETATIPVYINHE